MNQTEAILDHLKSGKSLTPLEALDKFGTMRLGARCFDIKSMGYPIRSEIVKGSNGKRYARYWLEKE